PGRGRAEAETSVPGVSQLVESSVGWWPAQRKGKETYGPTTADGFGRRDGQLAPAVRPRTRQADRGVDVEGAVPGAHPQDVDEDLPGRPHPPGGQRPQRHGSRV